jgi:hypothetical protein
MPLNPSHNIATTNHLHEPVARRTFIDPMFPLPCSVMSSPVTSFTMM